jgi:outer membrane protein assembly factor BamD
MLSRFFLILSITLLIFSCSKDRLIYEPSKNSDPYTLYKEGYDAFNKNDFFNASKKFSEAEVSFENIDLAAKSAIMNCFSLYGINFYGETLENIERFLKIYPSDKNVIYAEYLKAIIFFEQISDEKKDLEPLINAKKQIEYYVKKYPDSDYALDLKFKKDLIQNQLAAKELYNAKFYISVQKWIPAINRLKIIVKEYDKTVFIEEALHRLVEIHYHLGLENEAKQYTSILGYNYNSSEWYQKSYKILNKDYVIENIEKKERNKDSIFKKIIQMIK